MNKKIVVFDLDDTLYKEITFLKSAFQVIARCVADKTGTSDTMLFDQMMQWHENKENVFRALLTKHKGIGMDIMDLLDIYRNHDPKISISADTRKLLNALVGLNIKLGIITDGRSIQQRNKINALGLKKYFGDVIISEEFGSEKPCPLNYQYFMDKYGKADYYYIGDNTAKDFVSPNKLGWLTICLLDNGTNIHKQDFDLPTINLPSHKIGSLEELSAIL